LLLPPRKLIVIAIGVLLAGAPVLLIDYWISGLIIRQSASDIETFSRRSIHLADKRLSATLEALDGLAKRGIDRCNPEQIEALRTASLSVAWVKQMAVLGAAGQPICSDLSLPAGPIRIQASRPVRNSPAVIEVVQIGDHSQRMVRVRRPVGNGTNSLSALLPAEALVAKIGMNDVDTSGYGQLALLDGTIIEEIGTRPNDAESLSAIGANARVSELFGLRVTTSSPQIEEAALISGLREIALTITGIFAVLLLALGLLLYRRHHDDPVAELARALKAGEFVPYYQPTVDISTGRLRGAEVLMRWKKRDGSIVPPALFIPMAESSGLITEMTYSMMRQVIADLGRTCADRPKLSLSFNMTAQHFANENIVGDMRRIFERSPIRFSQIVLELTERQPLENLGKSRRLIASLQELGVRIAIDDVGTGHSGLSYILKLGPDIIKIDKLFVDALGSDSNSSTIVETLVDLAGSMRMDVIAEGVETFEQVIALRERGVRSAQGYVFAPPLPAASFLQLLEAIEPRPQNAESEQPGRGVRRTVSAA